MTPIAAKIKAHRAALKMTQAQYGAALDEPVSGQTISCWERGQWTPTTRHLISLSRLMTEPTEQPSLDDYASATTEQLIADAVSAATLPSDALAMSAELTRRHEDTDNMTQITAPSPNPQAITIDWQALVGTHQGVSGVSLRHLVSLGLYGQYRDAAAAIEREPGLFALTAKSVSLPSTGGRPAEDIIITDLRTVQRFCARARTEMGARIMDVILDHHDELQAMLAGDAAAIARHEQAKAPRPIDALDVMGAMLEQMRIQRDALAAQEARQLELESRTAEVVAQVGQLERRLETTPLAGELSAYDVALAAKVTAKSGKPHAMAVLELVYQMGLPQEGLARQVWGEVNGKLAPSWLIHQDGADMIKRELALMAKGGKIVNGSLCFTLKGRKRTYTVYR